MWPNPQETANLVTFTEEILTGKLNFFLRCLLLCGPNNKGHSPINIWLFFYRKFDAAEFLSPPPDFYCQQQETRRPWVSTECLFLLFPWGCTHWQEIISNYFWTTHILNTNFNWIQFFCNTVIWTICPSRESMKATKLLSLILSVWGDDFSVDCCCSLSRNISRNSGRDDQQTRVANWVENKNCFHNFSFRQPFYHEVFCLYYRNIFEMFSCLLKISNSPCDFQHRMCLIYTYLQLLFLLEMFVSMKYLKLIYMFPHQWTF